jgi:DNA ligase (NAD+)
MNKKDYEKELGKHQVAYTEGKPLIDDSRYDAMLAYYKEKFGEGSITMKVGAKLATDKVPHLTPMLSLDNLYNGDEIMKWVTKMKTYDVDILGYLIEPKLDGASGDLIYRDGKLVSLLTRGDGDVGTDITHNAKNITGIPLDLKSDSSINVRGEIVMEHDAFNDFNKQNKDNPLSNPRNGASSVLRSIDDAKVLARDLTFYPYEFITIGEPVHLTDVARAFAGTIPGTLVRKAVNVLPEVMNVLERREELPFAIDGAVIKLVITENDKKKIGGNSRAPRYNVAYKYPATKLITTLLDIRYQIGRFGAITPVATTEPVTIDGVEITSPTLHNVDFIVKNDIRIGDCVYIERACDVIPNIIGPVIDQRGSQVAPYKPPETCPCCNAIVDKSGPIYYCTNGACPDVLVKRIAKLLSRDVFDIKGLGESVAYDITKLSNVKTPFDIFKLTVSDLMEAGLTSKGAEQKFKAIQAALTTSTFDRFLYALHIKGFGRTATKTYARLATTMEEVVKLDHNKLVSKPVAKALDDLKTWLLEEASEWFALFTFDTPVEEKQVVNDHLSGEVVLTTGACKINRKEVKSYLEARGAVMASGFTGMVTLLVAGNKPGSGLRKAIAKGFKETDDHPVIKGDLGAILYKK